MQSRYKNSKGANMVEYALLAALIAVVLISSLRVLETKIYCRFTQIGKALEHPDIPSYYMNSCGGLGGSGGNPGDGGGTGGGG